MKALAALVAAALPLVLAQNECSSSVLSLFTKGETGDCEAIADFQITTVVILPPSPGLFTKMCGISSCQKLLSSLQEAVPADCKIYAKSIRTNFIDKFAAACAAPATAAPTKTPRPPTPSTTPAPTKEVPGATEPPQVPSGISSANASDAKATTRPTTNDQQTSNNSSKTTIVGVVAGVVVAIILVLVIVLQRRKRQQTPKTEDTPYVAVLDTDETHSRSTDMPEFHALVPYRVPYNHLQFSNRILSQGGFGEVLRAAFDGRDVAIKRLLASRRSDPQSLRSLVQEIQLTAMLQHECIIQFIGAAWEDSTSLCMVSEFMHGGDLRALLVEYEQNGHANGHDDTKLRIAIHVAHAMTYLHSLDPPVVHRDLKSKNVLLTASLDAKLIDFGVSREQQDETMTAGIGTSLWMAPEVMLGKRYDGKADVFSFGVILSELDTHELPYNHARETGTGERMTSMVLLNLISKGRLLPHFTDAAHPAIVKLARDCLQLDPTLRPTATEVVNRIDACLQHDWALTDQTRTALDRAIVTATTRLYGTDSVEILLDTKETTN